MTQEASTEATEAQGESNDNELIRSLREQIKEKDKQLKERPDRESLEAEIRTQLERDNAITAELGRLGHPAGILDAVKGRLEEGAEVSRETVAQALQTIGYQVAVEDGVEQSEGKETSSESSDLAQVTNLSTQVRAAASGGVDPAEALSKSIAKASTPQELAAAMQEAGLSTSYR